MYKILATCGNGMGSSLLMEMKVKNVFDAKGLEYDISHCSLGEAKTIANNYDIIFFSAFFNQTCMSLMKKSHCWNKTYSFTFFFPCFDLFSCFFYCFCYLHCYLLFLGQWTGIIDFEIASFLNSLSSYDSL